MPNPQIINYLEKSLSVFQGVQKCSGEHWHLQVHISLSSLLLQIFIPHSPAGSCPGTDLSLTPFTASVTSGPEPCSCGPTASSGNNKEEVNNKANLVLIAVRLPRETCCQLPCSRALGTELLRPAPEVGKDLVRPPKPSPCSSQVSCMER